VSGGEGLAERPGDDWTPREVEVIVRLYVRMLGLDVRGERLVKTEEYRRVIESDLPARSQPSVEYKLRNVSAVMEQMGLPTIRGLRPAENYQRILVAGVERALGIAELDEALRAHVAFAAERQATYLEDLDGLIVEPARGGSVDYSNVPRSQQRDWDDAERRRIGRLGEEWVVHAERARLARVGRRELADAVVHTALVEGDGAGYDIHSFDEDGNDRLIEVKTTASGIGRAFHVTRNELEVSRQREESYWLYRVFDFWSSPRMYQLAGAMDRTLQLDPRVYAALPRG
jgi:hypothetical protein